MYYAVRKNAPEKLRSPGKFAALVREFGVTPQSDINGNGLVRCPVNLLEEIRMRLTYPGIYFKQPDLILPPVPEVFDVKGRVIKPEMRDYFFCHPNHPFLNLKR